ncbi:EF-hand calcium-binding domain-containing protein 1-like isoform X2 [Lytechinus variegatus]|nr:EF-hand calcium-binding domain-containing protein 1-like isoform X2 [Lytechinus variegatus]
MFKDLTKDNIGTQKEGKLDRSQFRDVLHRIFKMTDDVIMDRVLRAFDKNNDACISKDEWLSGLSVYLEGNLEQKIEFCFQVYDLNSDGHISREEMFHLLKTSIVKQPTEEDPEEGIKDLVEILIKKMDIDHDGKLSYHDFRTSVYAEPLLLECFGTCLPEQRTCENFMLACKRRMMEDPLFPEPRLPHKGYRSTECCCSSDDEHDEEEDVLRIMEIVQERSKGKHASHSLGSAVSGN